MNKICSKEEMEKIAKELGYTTFQKFAYFLNCDYDFDEVYSYFDEEDFLSNDKHLSDFDERVKRAKEPLGIEDDWSNLPTEEKAMRAIAIIKRVNMDYIMDYYDGRVDEETAGKLVGYSYTHGGCISLVYTLYEMFGDECQLKIFKAGRYAHQCVCINGLYYDINGCSTEEEMKEFVAKEGGVSAEECVITNGRPLKSKQRLVDGLVSRCINRVFNMEKSVEESSL